MQSPETFPETLTAHAPCPERLRVAHFFLLTTVCAAVATLKLSWTRWDEIPLEYHNYFIIHHFFMSLVFGLALSTIFLFHWRRWHGGAAQWGTPGHWLLVCFAWAAISQAVVTLLYSMRTSYLSDPTALFYAWYVQESTVCTCVSAACFAVGYLMHASWQWKVVLYLPGCAMALMVPAYLAILFGYGGYQIFQVAAWMQIVMGCVLCPWMFTLAVRDYRKGKRLDWIHWMGVFVAETLSVAFVANGIYSLLAI